MEHRIYIIENPFGGFFKYWALKFDVNLLF
jgi:hypothetical protein